MYYFALPGRSCENFEFPAHWPKNLQLITFLYLQSQARLQLQLAPSLEHQVAAMLSILARYNWRQFSVVTSEIAGHDDFVQAVRDRVAFMKSQDRPEPIR